MAWTLALDIWVRVLSFSDLVAIVQCQQACRTLRDLVKETAELAYRKETLLRGYKPLRSSESLSITELRESLIQQDTSWTRLRFRVLSTIEAPLDAWFQTFYVCGDYAVCRVLPVTSNTLCRVHLPTNTFTPFTMIDTPVDWLNIFASEGMVAQITISADIYRRVTLSLRILSDLSLPLACKEKDMELSVTRVRSTSLSNFVLCGRHVVFIANGRSAESRFEERQMVLYDWTKQRETYLSNESLVSPDAASFLKNNLLAVLDNTLQILGIYDLTCIDGPRCTAMLALPSRICTFPNAPIISQVTTVPGRVLHSIETDLGGLLVVELMPRGIRELHRVATIGSVKELLVLRQSALPALQNSYTSGGDAPISWSVWGPMYATIVPVGAANGVVVYGSRILYREPHRDSTTLTQDFKLLDFGRWLSTDKDLMARPFYPPLGSDPPHAFVPITSVSSTAVDLGSDYCLSLLPFTSGRARSSLISIPWTTVAEFHLDTAQVMSKNRNYFRVSIVHSCIFFDTKREADTTGMYLDFHMDPERGCLFFITAPMNWAPQSPPCGRLHILEPVTQFVS